MININTLSEKAFSDIWNLDKSYIGTYDYLGLAYFWNMEYKHYLRDCTVASRRKVHNKLLKEGLKLDVISSQHEYIVKKYAKGYER